MRLPLQKVRRHRRLVRLRSQQQRSVRLHRQMYGAQVVLANILDQLLPLRIIGVVEAHNPAHLDHLPNLLLKRHPLQRLVCPALLRLRRRPDWCHRRSRPAAPASEPRGHTHPCNNSRKTRPKTLRKVHANDSTSGSNASAIDLIALPREICGLGPARRTPDPAHTTSIQPHHALNS